MQLSGSTQPQKWWDPICSHTVTFLPQHSHICNQRCADVSKNNMHCYTTLLPQPILAEEGEMEKMQMHKYFFCGREVARRNLRHNIRLLFTLSVWNSWLIGVFFSPCGRIKVSSLLHLHWNSWLALFLCLFLSQMPGGWGWDRSPLPVVLQRELANPFKQPDLATPNKPCI